VIPEIKGGMKMREMISSWEERRCIHLESEEEEEIRAFIFSASMGKIMTKGDQFWA